MNSDQHFTRRSILGTFALGNILDTSQAHIDPKEYLLVQAANRFEQMQSYFEKARADDQNYWNEFETICDSIVNARAYTSLGLFLKARTAAWARLGDLEPPQGQLDTRISISVLRDIIVQTEPSRYSPGALKKLIDDES